LAVKALDHAIRLQPDQPRGYLARAICHYVLRNIDDAVADFDQAHELGDRSAMLYGMRGCCHLAQGRYRPGRKDLRKAIRLNPGDCGRRYRPSTNKELSPEALAHGRRQVERMLQDRPAMQGWGAEDGVLRNWAVRKFAGEDLRDTVDWDPSPPEGANADHMTPTDSQRGRIRVVEHHRRGPREGQPRSCEALWSDAVFELHNIALAPDFKRTSDQAVAGDMEKRDFVFAMFEIENRATQRTRAFYVKVYLPLAEAEGRTTDPADWHAGFWGSAQQLFGMYTDRSQYPWIPYGRWYDWCTARRCFLRGEYAEARRLMESVAQRQIDPVRKAESHYWAGRCCDEQCDYRAAERAYAQAIRLQPNNSRYHTGRARARTYLEKFEEALADIEKAVQLDPADDYAKLVRVTITATQAARTNDADAAKDLWNRLRETHATERKSPALKRLDEGMQFDAWQRRLRLQEGRQPDDESPVDVFRREEVG
jgi:tetratricopeptide (TPR) repeat protein